MGELSVRGSFTISDWQKHTHYCITAAQLFKSDKPEVFSSSLVTTHNAFFTLFIVRPTPLLPWESNEISARSRLLHKCRTTYIF